MTNFSLTFDAISEDIPGSKWQTRWTRSWPEYRAWFLARGGQNGPSRTQSEAALARHMPELVPIHRRLSHLAGDSDLAARFLSTWCPPEYLGGCSVAALADDTGVRLVRNYDLSPDLNEGLLLRSEWTGQPVMGMIEFLWGVSDGVNAAGLAVALAYGGRGGTAPGFGITTILRYVLETCASVGEATAALRRIPSHMAYNITLADRHGATATLELHPGGGARLISPAITTNHQHGPESADRPAFTRTHDRRAHLEDLLDRDTTAQALGAAFLKPPLYQRDYQGGFGTLFTAVYDPVAGGLDLRWPDQTWTQSLTAFNEGRREIIYSPRTATETAARNTPDPVAVFAALRPHLPAPAARALDRWLENSQNTRTDWTALGGVFAGWTQGLESGPPTCSDILEYSCHWQS
jgi:predicted choloylglycine hydrolase